MGRGCQPEAASLAWMPAEVLPGLIAAAMPRLLALRGALRAILAEATVTGPDVTTGRTFMRELYATLGAYLEGQMRAGRLRPTHPLVAMQSLMGPLLLYALIRPDFWQDALGEQPSPQQLAAELVQIWLRGMQPDAPSPDRDGPPDT